MPLNAGPMIYYDFHKIKQKHCKNIFLLSHVTCQITNATKTKSATEKYNHICVFSKAQELKTGGRNNLLQDKSSMTTLKLYELYAETSF